jgi:lipoprotein-releasing system permease protein
MRIFVVQGAALGIAGTLGGTLLGILLAVNVEDVVAAIERVFGVHFIDPSVYYISKLPSQLEWSDVSLIAFGSMALSLLMTLYPAWRAYCTEPAEALRYE